MLFHEIYSTYFQTVAKILAEAVEHPLTNGEINAIIQDYAFEESTLNIPESLGMTHWQLLKEDGTTILRKKPTMPLTILQKRWINAIALDPRIRLFTDRPIVFSDVEPLFLPEDIYVFDKYSDGDPYENPEYIRNFRLILDAIKHKYQIQISITNRHGKQITTRTIPEYLEYSEKDDKFRLIGTGSKLGNTINLGRISSCEKYENQQGGKVGKSNQPRPRKVIFELIDERNALERVLGIQYFLQCLIQLFTNSGFLPVFSYINCCFHCPVICCTTFECPRTAISKNLAILFCDQIRVLFHRLTHSIFEFFQ